MLDWKSGGMFGGANVKKKEWMIWIKVKWRWGEMKCDEVRMKNKRNKKWFLLSHGAPTSVWQRFVAVNKFKIEQMMINHKQMKTNHNSHLSQNFIKFEAKLF